MHCNKCRSEKLKLAAELAEKNSIILKLKNEISNLTDEKRTLALDNDRLIAKKQVLDGSLSTMAKKVDQLHSLFLLPKVPLKRKSYTARLICKKAKKNAEIKKLETKNERMKNPKIENTVKVNTLPQSDPMNQQGVPWGPL